MSTSAGFSWKHPYHSEEMSTSPVNGRFAPKNLRKRRILDDEPLKQPPSSPAARKYLQRVKRSRTPKIAGLSLPVSRMVEVLDRKALQDLLQSVINLHPEVTQTVSRIAPRPTLKESVDLMKLKAEAIVAHLPYKCDTESDYSYIRIKPHLMEFLHTLSDFILNMLPPMELNLLHACQMLDEITCLMHGLPNFTNNEFQYTRATAYEQIANLWFIVLAHHNGDEAADSTEDLNAAHSVETLIEFAKTMEELDLVKKLEKHNELSRGKFQKVGEYVKSALDAYEQMNRALSGSGSIFNDLITVDYSNYSISARTSH